MCIRDRVDGDPALRPGQPGRRHRGPDAVARLGEGRVRKADQREAGDRGGEVGLDLDHVTVEADEGHRDRPTEAHHSTPAKCSTRAAPRGEVRTAMTSIRTLVGRRSWASSHWAASRRRRTSLRAVTASAGWPKPSPLRVLTSTTTSSVPWSATMSSSPAGPRQFRSSSCQPARARYVAATFSPYRPTASLARIGDHLHRERRGGAAREAARALAGCGASEGRGPSVDTRPRPPAHGTGRSAAERAAVRQVELSLGELLDVDVLERHHTDRLHEPRGAVDVCLLYTSPSPRDR